MKPYTKMHKRYHDSITDRRTVVTVGVGAAGCGKTYIACTAAIRMLTSKEVKKIIITRPAVCADESHGFLPGDINGKMQPFVRPIYDCLLDSINKQQLKRYLEDESIEIAPLAYMRGRTFSNAVIIADETQNMTVPQMKMLLTRVGMESKIVITGDPNQSDLKVRDGFNGLNDLMQRVEQNFDTSDECVVDVVSFTNDDILRNESIDRILQLYAY